MNRSSLTHRSFWYVSWMVLAALVLAACQPAATTTQAPAAAAATATTAAPATAAAGPGAAVSETPAAAAVINVASDPKLGKILVDGKGMTLYMFTKDGPDKSNCTAGCLKAWPPLLTQEKPQAGQGVDASLIGETTLADGSKIVTYNKMPLYYWAKDTRPGDTTGQGVNSVWYVVAPDGKAVGRPPVPATGSESGTLNVAQDAKLGKILVDSKGMTLYMFTKDEPDKSNCSGGCLQAWPPLVAQGDVKAGAGVDPALIGTTDLPDGRKIVTYNKMPLYYFAKDTRAGDTTGQDVNGVWYVVSPEGKKVDLEEAPSSTASSAANEAATNEAVVNVASDPKLGKILVDGKGMTLYMFTKDGPDKSNCTAGCLKAWPPLLTQGSPTAGAGVNASLLGATALADGTKIVTYNKMPLYYWAGDSQPGDTSGQGVNSVWYVVSPEGKPVGMQGSSTGY